MADWQIGLLGCFSDFKLCCITMIFSPITFGAIAENTGTDEMLCGALKSMIPIYNIIYFKEMRDKIATDKGIEVEGCCSFLMKLCCCGFCMVVQTGHEAGAFAMGEDIERV